MLIMQTHATEITTVLMFGFLAVIPSAFCSKINNDARRIRFTSPDQLCFRASKWAYAFLGMSSALLLGFSAFSAVRFPRGAWMFETFGAGMAVVTVLAFFSLKRARVTFNEADLSYTTLMKTVRVDYAQIRMAY